MLWVLGGSGIRLLQAAGAGVGAGWEGGSYGGRRGGYLRLPKRLLPSAGAMVPRKSQQGPREEESGRGEVRKAKRGEGGHNRREQIDREREREGRETRERR